MNEPTAQELVERVRHYYPTGSFKASDGYTQEVPPYTQTPEHQRWMDAWKRAIEWPEWDALLEELDLALDGVGDVTQPYMAACRRCSKSTKQPLQDGTHQVTYAVAAVSILAPLYVIYSVTETVDPRTGSSSQQFSFAPAQERGLFSSTLARGIERVLGCRPFPLSLSDVPIPEVFVPHLDGERATLLSALFDLPQQLRNLP